MLNRRFLQRPLRIALVISILVSVVGERVDANCHGKPAKSVRRECCKVDDCFCAATVNSKPRCCDDATKQKTERLAICDCSCQPRLPIPMRPERSRTPRGSIEDLKVQQIDTSIAERLFAADSIPSVACDDRAIQSSAPSAQILLCIWQT